jgi:hypothetical protein
MEPVEVLRSSMGGGRGAMAIGRDEGVKKKEVAVKREKESTLYLWPATL